jgi:hypothetical protein
VRRGGSPVTATLIYRLDVVHIDCGVSDPLGDITVGICVLRPTVLCIHLVDVPHLFGSGWLSVRSAVLGRGGGGSEVKFILFPLFAHLL